LVPRLNFAPSFSQDSSADESNDSDDVTGRSHTTITLRLNPCSINFDPGLVDRTYMLCNYAEFDPGCLTTPNDPRSDLHKDEALSSLLVSVISPQVQLNFFVPKADMRNPPEISVADFVAAFWSRTVHPEIFQIDMVSIFILFLLQKPLPVNEQYLAFSVYVFVSLQQNDQNL
jgi:hypothetical protein